MLVADKVYYKRACTVMLLFLLGTTSLHANAIDGLRSGRQVEQFLHQQGDAYKDLSVIPICKLFQDQSQRKTADSLKVKLWRKVDLNNDGRTDLLFYARNNSGEVYLLAAIDESSQYKICYFNRYMHSVCFPVLDMSGQATRIILYHSMAYISPAHIYRTDTLVYRYGYFVDWKPHPAAHHIEQIVYSAKGCGGGCPVFDLTVNAGRSALYSPKEHSPKQAVIDTASFSKIVSMLNDMDFTHLKDKYEVSASDQAGCTLTITYDDGQVKSIYDYGEQGTYGLAALYDALGTLRKTQRWEP